MPKRERGFFELYGDDPERADAIVFGRRTGISRRGFLEGAGLTALAAAVGGVIPFAANMPGGLIPAALAQATDAPKTLTMEGKAGLILLQERPLVAETPAHLLDDDVTPADKFYIRNNGTIPDPAADPKAWKIRIDGEVNQPIEISVGELETRFNPVSYQLQMECGGNGRSGFSPEARGNQWGNGAIGNAEWTGVPLKDILQAAGLKPSAIYTAHYGADGHLSGEPDRPSISRGMRLEKAMDQHTLVAFRMNGQPIPQVHGAPVRLVVPGWPGSLSHKWLTRIWIRDKEHDGPGMTGTNYRVTKTPMVPGGKTPDSNMVILEDMPVRSIITSPAHGTELPAGTRKVELRGAAWAGEQSIREVEISTDYGVTWTKAQVRRGMNKYAWQRWTAAAALPSEGYYEIWTRATDSSSVTQPFAAGNWNPQGYGGNAYHRIAVLVKA